MSNRQKPHTALDDLKRKAKEYKRTHSVCHSHALEAVARLAGYRCYADAKAELEGLPGSQP